MRSIHTQRLMVLSGSGGTLDTLYTIAGVLEDPATD